MEIMVGLLNAKLKMARNSPYFKFVYHGFAKIYNAFLVPAS